MPRQIFTIEVEYPLLDEDGDLMSAPADWEWYTYWEHYIDCQGGYSVINGFKVVQASAVTYTDADEEEAKAQDSSLLEMGIHR